MQYNDHLLQGDFSQYPSVMLLVHGIELEHSCLYNSIGIPEVYYETLSDGWHTGYQISVPPQEWLDRTIKECPETLSNYSTIYIIKDGQLNKYDYWTNTITLIDPIELIKNPNGKTNISISFVDFFITEKLENELIPLTEESLTQDDCKKQTYCCQKSSKTDNLKEKRNQLVNVLEIIKHYIECGDYENAQDLLDQYNNCFNQNTNTCCERRLYRTI